MSPIASTTIASTVVTRIEIRIAPRTRSTHREIISASPTRNTAVGQPERKPSGPTCTGTVVCAASGTRRTNPASTKPMNAMNRPIPTEIATFSCDGTAWKTAFRKPVRTSTRITTPSITIRPMTADQLIWGAIATATNAFSPSPVASASG